MSRLTDLHLNKIINTDGNYALYPHEKHQMAQELLELRAENERLKVKVLLGDELASTVADWKFAKTYNIEFPDIKNGEQRMFDANAKYKASGSGREQQEVPSDIEEVFIENFDDILA